MRAGRNDPCPCGSGKKYKKCCWSADAEQESKKPLLPTPPKPTTSSPPAWEFREDASREKDDIEDDVPSRGWDEDEDEDLDGMEDEGDFDEFEEGDESDEVEEANPAAVARWEEFEAADDHDQRLVLFERTLDEGLMDGENAYGMLEALREDMLKRGERWRFGEMIESIRRRAPEAFEEERVALLSWQVEDALAAGQLDRLPALAEQLGPLYGEDADLVEFPLRKLMYHGHLGPVLALYRSGWPAVAESMELLEWAVATFAAEGADMEVYAFLEANPQGDGNDTGLRDRVRFFVETLDEPRLAEHVDLLSARKTPPVNLADYQPAAQKKKGNSKRQGRLPDEVRFRLADLCAAFAGHLRREHGTPYTRAHLARTGLNEYLRQRMEGEFQRAPRSLDNPLVPDHGSLDEFLGGCLSLLSSRLELAFATFEAVPAWLRYLVALGLADLGKARAAFQALRRLRQDMGKIAATWSDETPPDRMLSAWYAEL